ncbi:hypothetical protein IX314_001111 [Fusobacterium sp. DD26]|nr:replication protein [Fusobacterium sp. DD28]MBR8701304.1 hypothetical protein [Fusobacterium sp. DD45]MBR8711080.1 hypothetical protein [Fusobacterium sp. DD28]MBR8751654.1 hypothetical protein [Fusobacterium sp. DD26]
MAIIKIKTRQNPYLQIDKTGINDPNLSFKATGLLAYLVGLPADWKIVLEQLATAKSDGLASCKAALKELRANNYCHYFEIRKSGKVVETFYMIYEVPTPFTEQIEQELLDDIDDKENAYKILYKAVNSKDSISECSQPKVDFPLAAKPLAENHRLQINNITNNTINKNHDHEEHDLDIFEKLFKEEFNINFTLTNQKAIKKLLLKQSEQKVIDYLVELYSNLKSTPGVKNIAALFSSKLKKGERQITKKEREKILEKEKPVNVASPEEIRKKLRERCNYYLNLWTISHNKNNSINRYKHDTEIYKNSYPELVQEYEIKLKKALSGGSK